MNKILQPLPEELHQLFVKAGEDHQGGLLDSAKSGYLRLLDYFPEVSVLHYNLGLVYYQQGEYEKSRNSFARAADINPEDMDILFNLALSKKKTGDIEGAILSYIRILDTDPKSVDTLYNLAGCYKDSEHFSEAITIYLELLQSVPEHLSANNNLAFVYQVVGETEQAVYYYKKVLEYKPDHQSAQHMLAALTDTGTASSPAAYVRDVFDNYSSYYEQSLVVELEYSVPSTIRKLLRKDNDWKKTYDQGLDLGCGTGLGAEALIEKITVLDGIDLSEQMIVLAKAKKIYRKLYTGHIVDFLNSSNERYDFFLAADVFAYVGDLTETFSLLKDRARPDVLFCFSTETLEGEGFRLRQTGRFAHSPSYVKQLALETGWKVMTSHQTSLRKEKGSWVPGDLWFLRLQASTD